MAVNRRAIAQRDLGRLEEALATSSDAVSRAKALLEPDKNNRDCQHFLGRSLAEKGRTLVRLPDRREQVEKCFGDAILIWQNLQQRFPQDPRYHDAQAQACLSR